MGGVSVCRIRKVTIIMPLLSACQIPAPKNWQDFEALCVDLWREELQDSSIQRYGRTGQAQQGVDIVGRPKGSESNGRTGIQCKCIESNSVLDKSTIQAEIVKARNFMPPLSQYIIATTGRKDVRVEQLCRTINDQYLKEGLFTVTFLGWEDIVLLLDKHPSVIANHFPFLRPELTQLVLTNDNSEIGRHWQHLRYSFVREEFVHPLIIKELFGWLSDRHETVIAVDLTSSNRSNRFWGDYSVQQFDGVNWIHYDNKGGGYFKYCHLGASSSGIHIVHCVENGGGTGVFNSLLFLVLQTDTGIFSDMEGMEVRERILLKTLGSIALGDRYFGKLLFDNAILHIGKDESPMKYGGLLQDILLEIK